MTVAAGDEPDAVGVRQGEVEVVGRHDDGETVVREVGDDQGQLDPAGDVEERRRLVEDEHRSAAGRGRGRRGRAGAGRPTARRTVGPTARRHRVGPPRRGRCDVLGRQVAAPAGVWMAAEQHDVADGEQARIDPIGEHHGDLAGPFASVEAGAGHVPSRSTSPRERRLGCRSSVRSNVDLPLPFGPITAVELPGRGGERRRRRATGVRRPSPGGSRRRGRCASRTVADHVITSPRPRRVSTQMTTGTPSRAVTALSGSTPRCPGAGRRPRRPAP